MSDQQQPGGAGDPTSAIDSFNVESRSGSGEGFALDPGVVFSDLQTIDNVASILDLAVNGYRARANMMDNVELKSADYTILDDDANFFAFSTASTATLPTAADNAGRTILIVHNAPSGTVTIDGEGAETVNGVASVGLLERYDQLWCKSDGSEWLASTGYGSIVAAGETAMTHQDDQTGYNTGGGTTTPSAPSVSASVGFRSVTIRWNRQLDLTNHDRDEIQVSDDQVTYYDLRSDGVDWRGTAGLDTDVDTQNIKHDNIPLLGTSQLPTPITLFYRVRRVTKEPISSSYSSDVSAVIGPIVVGDIDGL